MGDPIPDEDKLREVAERLETTAHRRLFQDTAEGDLMFEAASLLRTQEAELSRLRDQISALKGEGDAIARERELLREENVAHQKYLVPVHQRITAAEQALAAAQAGLERASELTAIVDRLASADREIMADSRSRGGLADCVDNTGQAYQSQWLADQLTAATKLSAEITETLAKIGGKNG